MAQRKRSRHRCVADGTPYAVKLARARAINEAIDSEVLEVKTRFVADRQAQRALWMAAIATAEVFGAGPTRVRRWLEKLNELSEEFNELVSGADEEYADEKLRRRASEVSGTEVQQLYQDEVDASRAHRERKMQGGRYAQ